LLGLVLAAVVADRLSARWWALGLLIGSFLSLNVLGGPFVALIVSFGG
jgi:hypothetical protein